MKRIKEIEAAMKSKAQEFLNQKARVKHYRISGVFNEEYGDGDTWAFFEYTDEEVTRLKHLFSEALVSYLNLPNKEYSLEEIKEEANLWELKGQIEELDEQFFTPCEDSYFMDPLDIDFERPIYFYNMSCYVFNAEEKKVQGPAPFRIQLSDEEYVYLLTQQLICRNNFTLNRLFEMNPELAMKINRQAEDAYYGFMSFYRMPFLVTMDEVIEDVYQFIDGFIFVHKVMKGIPADDLKKCLKASDYIKMMDNLKEKYSDFFAFNRISSFLAKNNIKSELTVESEDLADCTYIDD